MNEEANKERLVSATSDCVFKQLNDFYTFMLITASLHTATAHLKVLLMMNSATLMMSLGKWQRRNMMTMQMRTVARFTSLCEELFLLDLTWAYLHHGGYIMYTLIVLLFIYLLDPSEYCRVEIDEGSNR